ncbi:MAG: EamA family transporter [Roseitalea sp.]|nr:EamA family transporter [Roseitalea sp.]MBO6952020.1 EamA family transporter [Rhizobiaceae bacterium]MBO6592134.1 EamA family transporter [Roseitalea sp.]MBO6598389.1 EamA family transporter [Roseitalea sp.]MBO6610835.1 EamA family transporter [Roseitalea sp.]
MTDQAPANPAPANAPGAMSRMSEAVPPHAWFGVSAVFHYLGPAFAVLLFPVVGVLGVAWFRIASAALVFAPITKPWRTFKESSPRERLLLLALGGCLAVMNSSFYLALDRLPISLVAAIEFVGTIGIALWGLRTGRNYLAFAFAIIGVALLIDVPSLLAADGPALTSDLLGLFWAVLNGSLFVLYIILGHKISEGGASGGVERLGAAMTAAFIFVMPIGFLQALDAFGAPLLVLAGIAVGICSSVIPYVCDQLAMARLPRASFAFLLALLPASATIIGVIVLRQIPSAVDVLGVVLVMIGVAVHKPAPLPVPAANGD